MDHDESPARVWRGSGVMLRVIEPTDCETCWGWNQDDEQTPNRKMIQVPQSRTAAKQWADQESLRKPEGDGFRFVIAGAGDTVVTDLT